MRRMLLDAPWWGWALVNGILFGVFEVVVMGPFMARRSGRQRAEFSSYDDLRAASRAAVRGTTALPPR